MDCRRRMPGWLGQVAWLTICSAGWAGSAGAAPPERGDHVETVALGWLRGRTPSPRPSWSRFDLEVVPEEFRGRIQAILDKPTLQARAPAEAFHCQPWVYHWLLDHPADAVTMWRKLGAEVTPITDRGNGCFGWKDDQGSDVHWQVVVRDPREQAWYAEGVVRPGPLLPLVSVRAFLDRKSVV